MNIYQLYSFHSVRATVLCVLILSLCVCVCLVGDHGEGEGGSVALGAVVGVLERERRKYVATFEVCFVPVCLQ